MPSPFAPSTSPPGHGAIQLSLLPPSTPVLQTLSYQYPLKLIAPAAIALSSSSAHGSKDAVSTEAPPHLIHTIFVLTYGGGLVAGDTINLRISLAPTTRLVLLTQGSTKIFKSPSRGVVSAQRMHVSLAAGAGLVYLPDPVQPFANSSFEQSQIYELEDWNRASTSRKASLCVLDWVSEGRTARGERWNFWRYGSRNEVLGLSSGDTGTRRLLLRDNLVLDEGENSAIEGALATGMDGLGVFGTLILRGPLFERLGIYFMQEFGKLPRIGARKWDGIGEEKELTLEESRRVARQEQETKDGLLWTAATIRGFVLVKFGANEVEGARRWLSHMLKTEGSVEREFGERALLCLR